MKKRLIISLTVALIIVLLVKAYYLISKDSAPSQKTEITYTERFVSELKVTLSDADSAELDECIERCEELLCNNSSADALALTDTLEALDSKYRYFEEQLEAATILYYYDLSDKKLEDDYLLATDTWEDVQKRVWDFYNSARADNKVLVSLISDFVDKNYPDRLAYNEEPSQYLHEMTDAQSELMQYNNNASYEEAIDPFNKFLYASLRYAQAFGYDNYYEYATDILYKRDYTKYERKLFREYVKEYIVPIYKKYKKKSDDSYAALSSSEKRLSDKYLYASFDEFSENYLFDYFDSLPDEVGRAMREAFEKDRVLIGDKENSYQTANVRNIGDVPVCYFFKDKTDIVTVSHELGHYYAAVMGADNYNVSMDLKELHSQANTMLMISFLQREIDNEAFDSFCDYFILNEIHGIICSTIKDEFCEKVFTDKYTHYHTIDELNAVMEQLIDEYGISEISPEMERQLMTYWNRQAVSNAGYNLSYSVSEMVAFQIYQMSLTDYESAALCYRGIVEKADKDGGFLITVLNNKLLSPFDEKAFRIFE